MHLALKYTFDVRVNWYNGWGNNLVICIMSLKMFAFFDPVIPLP